MTRWFGKVRPMLKIVPDNDDTNHHDDGAAGGPSLRAPSYEASVTDPRNFGITPSRAGGRICVGGAR